MGMYVCDDCFRRYRLTDAPSGTNHAICEICAPLNNDWSVKFGVHFTWDIDRPFTTADPKGFVLAQLEEHANRHQV